jgi:hypothetical protein
MLMAVKTVADPLRLDIRRVNIGRWACHDETFGREGPLGTGTTAGKYHMTRSRYPVSHSVVKVTIGSSLPRFLHALLVWVLVYLLKDTIFAAVFCESTRLCRANALL